MDKFAGLKAFTGVVEEGGFAAASRVNGLSRSQTNKLVIALEEELGVQLFSRSTRHVAPTSEGLAFYERARQILDDLDEAEASLSETSTEAVGRLRISTPLPLGSLNFSAILVGFMKCHPALQLELVQEARLSDPIAEGFDCVIRVAAPDEETHMVDHRITLIQYATCAAAEYLEKAGTPTRPDDLKDHSLLHYPGSNNSNVWEYIYKEDLIAVPIKPILVANNLEAIREAACGGLGIATLPRYAVQNELQAGSMVEILTDYDLPGFMLQLIYPPSRHLSAKVRLLTDYLIRYFDESPVGR
ncbi:MAG: LysR substrate-binding domain-containing protein [Pseudomonadota bacterium]